MEIPAIGTLFCAERTSDHLQMYNDGEEAIFFDGPDECADRCLFASAAGPDCEDRGGGGRKRVLQNGEFNENLLTRIVSAAFEPQPYAGVREKQEIGAQDYGSLE